VWGLVGFALYFAVGISGLFGLNLEFLIAPLALNEMVLAVCLILKGFNRANVHKAKRQKFTNLKDCFTIRK